MTNFSLHFPSCRGIVTFLLTASLIAVSLTTNTYAAPPTPTPSSDSHTPDPLQKLLEEGKFEELEKTLQRRRSDGLENFATYSVRSRLALLHSNLQDAEKFALEAKSRATASSQVDDADTLLARVKIAQGDFVRAEEILRKILGTNPNNLDVRVLLGELLQQQGKYSEARIVLRGAGDAFNRGAVKTTRDFANVGRAMQLIGQYQDANLAFSRAMKLDKKAVAERIAWANLYLQKYDVEEAKKQFELALAASGGTSPYAILGLIKLTLQISNQTDKIRQQLDEIAKILPNNRDVNTLYAAIAMSELDCDSATRYATKLHNTYPKDLEALTILGTCSYFTDKPEEYDRYTKAIFDINPKYTTYYTTLGKEAVNRNRYQEGIEFQKKGLAIESENPDALFELGVGYSRTRKEDLAVDLLAKAFQADPYNGRALNMKHLYTKILPQEYLDDQNDTYLLRAHKNEAQLLKPLIAPLVTQALRTYNTKYQFTPQSDLAIEIYADPTEFAVRTVGTPNITPHGICFGHVVLSRTPREGNFNWAQVMWHELAHVYHLQLSNGRVPRWFTEGLAEYETNIKDPTWNRHHDQELAQALYDGTMASIDQLSNRFSHAKSDLGVLQAYHQSSLTIHYIVERWGFAVIPKMLRAWSENLSTKQVFSKILKITPAEFDDGFRNWLSKKYLIFKYLMPPMEPTYTPIDEVDAALKKNPEDAVAWVKASWNALIAQDPTKLEQAYAQAAKYADASPNADWVNGALAVLSVVQRRSRDALAYGEKGLAGGRDNVGLRTALGKAAQRRGDLLAAEVHFQAATTMWPDAVDAWRGLYSVATARKNDALAKRALREVFRLDAHDPLIARKIFDQAKKSNDVATMLRMSRQLMNINPFQLPTLRMAAQAAIAAKDENYLQWVKSVWQQLPSQSPADVERAIEKYRRKK